MALSKKRRPIVLIKGRVLGLEPRQEYRDGKPTGTVGRYDVTLLQPSYATPDVRFPVSKDAPELPQEGDEIAVIADCGESDEYGANFRVVRYATEDDLEAFASIVVQAA